MAFFFLLYQSLKRSQTPLLLQPISGQRSGPETTFSSWRPLRVIKVPEAADLLLSGALLCLRSSLPPRPSLAWESLWPLTPARAPACQAVQEAMLS